MAVMTAVSSALTGSLSSSACQGVHIPTEEVGQHYTTLSHFTARVKTDRCGWTAGLVQNSVNG
jgi:hypothetical protein